MTAWRWATKRRGGRGSAGLPVVDGPAAALGVAADDADAEWGGAGVLRPVLFDESGCPGAADGAGRFAAGDRVLAVGALELCSVSGLVEGSESASFAHVRRLFRRFCRSGR